MTLLPVPAFVIDAMNWVEKNLSFFSPSSEESLPTDHELQAWAELAVVALLWRRNRENISLPSMEKIGSFLTTLAVDSRLWHRAVRFPSEFLPLCDLISATRGPDSDPQFHALQQIIYSGALDGSDRTLVSDLEVRLSIDWAGLHSSFPSLEAIGRKCPKPPLPMFANNEACYSLTHLIIFATDFGKRPPPSSGGLSDQNYLTRILSSHIVRCVSDGNLDLLIELLLSWHYLRLPRTPLIQQAWRFFVSHQSPDGSFHRRVVRNDKALEITSAPAPDRTWFVERYHTTLLVLMAGGSLDIQLGQPGISDATPESYINEQPFIPKHDVRASALAEATWRWVNNEAIEFDDNLETVGFSLLIWWIWRALAGDADDSNSPPENLLRRTRDFELGSYFSVRRGSMTLNIITAGLLRRFDADNSNADGFLKHISAIVETSDSEDVDEELALCEKKVILNALGFEHHPYRSDYAEIISAAERCALGAERDSVLALLIRIESLTGYGTREVEIESGDVWLRDLLQGLADDAFRKYDWPLACRCVRALLYLKLITRETSQDYMTFFALHQQENGAFGYLGPDSKALLSGSGGYKSIDEINLSIAVEAMWTIAELATSGRWRLFESLGELSAARQWDRT